MLHTDIVYFHNVLKFFMTYLRLMQADCDNGNHENNYKDESKPHTQSEFHVPEHGSFILSFEFTSPYFKTLLLMIRLNPSNVNEGRLI
jgi:hypothetical protein